MKRSKSKRIADPEAEAALLAAADGGTDALRSTPGLTRPRVAEVTAPSASSIEAEGAGELDRWLEQLDAADRMLPRAESAVPEEASPIATIATGADATKEAVLPPGEPRDLETPAASANGASLDRTLFEIEGLDPILSPEPASMVLEDLNKILAWCSENGVADVFVASSRPVRVKRHGRMVPVTTRRLETLEVMTLLNGVKKNAEGTLLQGKYVDDRYDFALDRERRYGYRVNVTGKMEPNGEDNGLEIVLRAMPQEIPTAEDIGLSPQLMKLCMPDKGLVIITGPTGSGKSSMLATVLQERVRVSDDRIITYEDPPEYPLSSIKRVRGQIEQHAVGRHVTDFADGIRNALRRAPDGIMLGEARDRETIAMTIRAAETGHVVYATVHTSNVISAIDRMADEFPVDARWGVKTKLVNAMRLIVNQKLVPKVGGGRLALREYLHFPESFRNKVIEAGPDSYYKLMQEGLQKHGRPLIADAEEKYAAGQISRETYLIVKEDRGDD